MRLWSYGGPAQQLNSLRWDEDKEAAELIRSVVSEGHGEVAEPRAELFVSHFENPFHALAAAKTLQQRLLTFLRKQPSEQVVASMVVAGRKDEAAPLADCRTGIITTTTGMLVDGNSAQILVTEEIYELARNVQGFQFNPKPAREAGEGGVAESVYELLWTDESTYGHLRKASRSGDLSASRASRYEIQTELGRGAMGIVYKAYDHLIGRTVALKTISINRNAPDREELIERLKQEAKAAGGLDHPNIITIYDVGQDEDLVYLSMQFLEGKTLLALLNNQELPELPTLLSYADQICSAVGYAHTRNVIHRDLKPANFMLTSHGVVKVLDFGIAKVEDATLTQPGLVVGTPTYMAPEQARGKKIDHRADIFALGSVFYELFTREKPFKGDVTTILYKIIHEEPVPPSVINPALPGGIDAVIRKALAKEPKDRFQSCEEMRKAFREQSAVLKKTTGAPNASTGAATAAAPKMEPRPAPASADYLLDTTTVRPPRRVWPWVVILLVFAIAGVSGWAFYVQSRTGAFPPPIEKVLAMIHRGKPQAPAQNSPPATAGPTQPAAGGSSSSAAITDPSKPSSDSSGASAPASVTSGDTIKPQPMGDNAASAGTPLASTTLSTAASPSTASPSTASSSTPGQPPATATQPASTTPQNGTTQPAGDNTGVSTTTKSGKPANSSAASADGAADARPESSKLAKATKKPAAGPASVDGFTRRDIPDLLRQADAAAGRADYRQARYVYNLILKLDRSNAAARSGLRRVQSAEGNQ